jgi:hypothetical protein
MAIKISILLILGLIVLGIIIISTVFSWVCYKKLTY